MTAIETKYLPRTEHRDLRIKATAGNGAGSVIMSVSEAEEMGLDIPRFRYENSEEHSHRMVAIALCKKRGWTGEMICGGTKAGYTFVFTY
jgi:hypothetical protein